MAGKRDKPEEVVLKLRLVEVLQGQGMRIAEAVRQLGVSQQTYCRWRKRSVGSEHISKILAGFACPISFFGHRQIFIQFVRLRRSFNGGRLPQPVDSTSDPSCGRQELRLFPLHHGTRFSALAAFTTLRAQVMKSPRNDVDPEAAFVA